MYCPLAKTVLMEMLLKRKKNACLVKWFDNTIIRSFIFTAFVTTRKYVLAYNIQYHGIGNDNFIFFVIVGHMLVQLSFFQKHERNELPQFLYKRTVIKINAHLES